MQIEHSIYSITRTYGRQLEALMDSAQLAIVLTAGLVKLDRATGDYVLTPAGVRRMNDPATTYRD